MDKDTECSRRFGCERPGGDAMDCAREMAGPDAFVPCTCTCHDEAEAGA